AENAASDHDQKHRVDREEKGEDEAVIVDDGEAAVDRGRCTEQTDEQPFDRGERGNAASTKEPPDDRQCTERYQPGDVFSADRIERVAARDVSDVREQGGVHEAPSKTARPLLVAASELPRDRRSSAITAIGSAICVSSVTIGSSACASSREMTV